MIAAESLVKTYSLGESTIRALDGVSLEVAEGEMIAITGASGPIYGVRTLELLRREADVETHLILSAGGRTTIAHETDWAIEEVCELADVVQKVTI